MLYTTFTRALALLTLSASATAQNATFIAELLQALQGSGLTSLATAAQSVANTTTGQSLLSVLGTGPQTVFAPTNAGFEGAHPNITSDPELLAQVLSYHVLPGTFAVNDTPTFPNTSVARTLLNSSSLVFLEGNKNQVLAWTNDTTGIRILNQNTPVTVSNTTSVGNLTIHTVNAVIDVPGDLLAAIVFWNLTAASQALSTAGLLDSLNSVHGFTLFAPNDAAFAAAQANLTSLAGNATASRNVLLNHVVSGTSVYTGNLIGGDEATSAAGETISSSFNSSGGFVTSGNATARIVQPDIILWNGVVHIIDTVLLNTESNQQAAESAASSASEQATSTSSETETGPIGFTPSPTSGSGAGSSNAAQASLRLPTVPGGGGSSAAFMTALVGAVVGALVVY